ncbi:MAG: hypothetical protein ACRDSJ_08785 [Rubrobacteraceae bacterium]
MADLVTEVGSWLEIVVPDHTTRLDERGYPGWVEPERFLEAPGWNPTRKVVRPNAANLPLGALLEERGGTLLLPDGSPAEIGEGESSETRAPHPRRPTDSTTGMDCSDLVCRVMQLLGVPVPATPTTSSTGLPSRAAKAGKTFAKTTSASTSETEDTSPNTAREGRSSAAWKKTRTTASPDTPHVKLCITNKGD